MLCDPESFLHLHNTNSIAWVNTFSEIQKWWLQN